MNPPRPNLPSSVRQRLLNLSKEENEDYQFVLTRYALERLLYRLSKSKYCDQFVLKGALLFVVWSNQRYRPTKDMDLLGFGDSSPERLRCAFQEICLTEVEPDGLVFGAQSVATTEIRDGQEYEGQRIKLMARLENARIPLQIDVAFGDSVKLDKVKIDFPTMLGMPQPRIRVYPRDAVVAEKLQAIVDLGMQNSRMKDIFDLYFMARFFTFDGSQLVEAITATFERRRTSLPIEVPVGLSDEFAKDLGKRTQWKTFLQKNNLRNVSAVLEVIIGHLRQFVLPPLQAAAQTKQFNQFWKVGGPWRARAR